MAAPSPEERDVSADVAWNTEMDEELKRVLLEYGNGLLKPSDSIEELLEKLDKLEHLLQHFMQERKPVIEMTLKPAEEALISNALMRHEEVNVRITVVSCISEIIRITAPKEPYNEDQTKDYFKLVNTAYQKLPSLAGRAYTKAVSIIQTVSSCQICILMLDFELHDTVLEMFHLFLDGIQSSHPPEIISSMERIRVLMFQNAGDSEEFSLEAAKILLSTLKKGNENVSPCAFQLARNVCKKCANELKNYLPEAVRDMGVVVQEYDDVVISLLHGTTQSDDMNHSKKKKRSLSKKALGETSKGEIVFSENQMGDSIVETLASQFKGEARSEEAVLTHASDFSYKEEASEVNDAKKRNGEDLVGCKIKVWWPLDETYYEGTVTSFDHLEKTHKVDYDDGEREILDLTKERWELIDDNNLFSHEQKTVPPPPSPSRVVSHGRRGKSSHSSETKLKGLSKQILG